MRYGFGFLFSVACGEKTQNVYDFNDVAHFALRLLVTCDENGEVHRTAVAEELRTRYYEILLDEYQDTNEAQDMLFSAISNDGNNLFTVGDLKQSIYGFRLAMPEIFCAAVRHITIMTVHISLRALRSTATSVPVKMWRTASTTFSGS